MASRILRVASPVVVALIASACASGASRGGAHPPVPAVHPPDLAPTVSAKPVASAHQTIVATARVPTVAVFERPRVAGPAVRLSNPQPSGAPLVFVVRKSMPGWLDVLLPLRPNGSSGWIRRGDVTLRRHNFRIVVELREHLIIV